MKEFNYQDYLIYQKSKEEMNPKCQLRDIDEIYTIEKVDKPHDKIFKIVLSEKTEVAELINRLIIMPQKLAAEDIERYSTEHIDYLFRESESDIVYKMKHREIFFLIEHQRTIDYNMPKRILEYEVEIIKEATKGKIMTKRNHKLPSIIPIVIYTGSRKWNVEKYVKECQEILEGTDTIKLGEYYVVDANDYSNEELEKDEFFLPKMLLLEKLNEEEELFQALNKIIDSEKDENNQNLLKRVVSFIIRGKLPSENVEILLKKLESEEKDMIIEVLQKENERQRKMGIKQGIKQSAMEIAKKLLELGISLDNIEKATGLTQNQIEKLQDKS